MSARPKSVRHFPSVTFSEKLENKSKDVAVIAFKEPDGSPGCSPPYSRVAVERSDCRDPKTLAEAPHGKNCLKWHIGKWPIFLEAPNLWVRCRRLFFSEKLPPYFFYNCWKTWWGRGNETLHIWEQLSNSKAVQTATLMFFDIIGKMDLEMLVWMLSISAQLVEIFDLFPN